MYLRFHQHYCRAADAPTMANLKRNEKRAFIGGKEGRGRKGRKGEEEKEGRKEGRKERKEDKEGKEARRQGGKEAREKTGARAFACTYHTYLAAPPLHQC